MPFWFSFNKNVEIILNSWILQKQMVGRIWPAGCNLHIAPFLDTIGATDGDNTDLPYTALFPQVSLCCVLKYKDEWDHPLGKSLLQLAGCIWSKTSVTGLVTLTMKEILNAEPPSNLGPITSKHVINSGLWHHFEPPPLSSPPLCCPEALWVKGSLGLNSWWNNNLGNNHHICVLLSCPIPSPKSGIMLGNSSSHVIIVPDQKLYNFSLVMVLLKILAHNEHSVNASSSPSFPNCL